MIRATRKIQGLRISGDLSIRMLAYGLLAAVVVITLYPMVWMVAGSLKSDAEFYTNIWGLPGTPMWSNYREAWMTARLDRSFVNSMVVTCGTVAIVLASSSLAAYAFATISFPGSKVLFYFFLISLMVPQGVLALPIFTVVSRLGLVNTRLSMILVYTAGYMGFGIFVLRAYFMSIPADLRDAAVIDGCTLFSAFWRVVLPLARPGLAVLLIFAGLGTWNEYFLGSLLVRSSDLRTLPLALVSFVEQHTTHYPEYFATLVLMTLPVVALYIVGQKQFQSGLTASVLQE